MNKPWNSDVSSLALGMTADNTFADLAEMLVLSSAERRAACSRYGVDEVSLDALVESARGYKNANGDELGLS